VALRPGAHAEGVRTAFTHYGRGPSGQRFRHAIREPTAEDLDELFASHDADLLFHGHDHSGSDVEGRARYVNPGSLGCSSQAVARYCVAQLHQGRYTVEHRAVPYDDARLLRAFEQRAVPERTFIYRAFFGGRWRARSPSGARPVGS
jgi:hypothetical protein